MRSIKNEIKLLDEKINIHIEKTDTLYETEQDSLNFRMEKMEKLLHETLHSGLNSKVERVDKLHETFHAKLVSQIDRTDKLYEMLIDFCIRHDKVR